MSLANALAMLNEQERIKSEGEVLRQIERYTPPPGVIPESVGEAALAMDSHLTVTSTQQTSPHMVTVASLAIHTSQLVSCRSIARLPAQ
jgi:hypothetical protein